MHSDGTFAVTWTESNGNAPGTAASISRTYDADGTALQDHDILGERRATRPATRWTRR